MFTNSNPATATDLICLNKDQWGFMSIDATIFGMTISLMILLAINASQYIIIRIPNGMKIFDDDLQHNTGLGLRILLSKKISDEPERANL